MKHGANPTHRWLWLARVLAVCALVAATSARAETLVGEVVAIADGDTLTVLDSQRRQHRVRLAGIDAPEKRQPFGDRSRQSLAALAFRHSASVEWHKLDRYGRIVGVVKVRGADVGLQQVRLGLAWHYKQYQREQSASERREYAAAEVHARESRLGLWRDPEPEPPWDFRRRGRRN